MTNLLSDQKMYAHGLFKLTNDFMSVIRKWYYPQIIFLLPNPRNSKICWTGHLVDPEIFINFLWKSHILFHGFDRYFIYQAWHFSKRTIKDPRVTLFITYYLPGTHSLSSHKSPLALDKHAPWERYVHVQCLKMQEKNAHLFTVFQYNNESWWKMLATLLPWVTSFFQAELK